MKGNKRRKFIAKLGVLYRGLNRMFAFLTEYPDSLVTFEEDITPAELSVPDKNGFAIVVPGPRTLTLTIKE
jgi:hypothetical protein